jgi:hypothetical protein
MRGFLHGGKFQMLSNLIIGFALIGVGFLVSNFVSSFLSKIIRESGMTEFSVLIRFRGEAPKQLKK